MDGWFSSVIFLSLKNLENPIKSYSKIFYFSGETCLHFASEEGHASLVQLLMEKGCRIDAKNNLGNIFPDL